jgi:hypothetical protein
MAARAGQFPDLRPMGDGKFYQPQGDYPVGRQSVQPAREGRVTHGDVVTRSSVTSSMRARV